MKLLFVLAATLALLFSCVSAQSNATLCDLNFLTTSPNNTFVCSENATLELENVTIPANPSTDILSAPSNESLLLTFSKDNLSGTYKNGSFSEFWLQIDAGSAVGVTAAAQIDYDFDGDGTWDRKELYSLFAADPVPDSFETWHGSSNSTDNVTGDFEDLTGGSIRLRLWSAFGGSPLFLRIGAPDNTTSLVSNISFPFTFSNASTNETGGPGTGGGTGGGSNETCCEDIADIRSELNELADRVDILSSRLRNVTQTCCPELTGTATATAGTAGTAGTATGTFAGTATGTAAGTETSVAVSTAVETATVSATATVEATVEGTA